jgi:hypothetical protein
MADLASLIAEVLEATAEVAAGKARLEVARPLLEAEMRAAHIKSMDPPGAEILLTKPDDVATVTDMAALVKAIDAEAPSEIVTTRGIRDRFLKAILDDAARYGVAAIPGTGTPLPGIEVSPGRSVMRVTLKGEQ